MFMFLQERHAAICRQLERVPRMPIEKLQQKLGVSRSTIRRDLLELEQQGQVIRVHGGVIHPHYLRGESTFKRRSGEQVDAKRRIAKAAAERVPENAAVLIDAGTTCLEVGLQLLSREDVKLYTHNIQLVMAALDGEAAARVTCLGGELRMGSGALIGGLAEAWLGRLRCDVAFIAASGLDADDGPSATEIHEASIKTVMLSRAHERILVCDASKCDKPAAVTFASWDQFDVWVVDRRPSKPYRHVVASLYIAR